MSVFKKNILIVMQYFDNENNRKSTIIIDTSEIFTKFSNIRKFSVIKRFIEFVASSSLFQRAFVIFERRFISPLMIRIVSFPRKAQRDTAGLRCCTRLFAFLESTLARENGDAISLKEKRVSKLSDGTAYRRLEGKKVSGWLSTVKYD